MSTTTPPTTLTPLPAKRRPPSGRLITADEFLALPPRDGVVCELINGKIVEMSNPGYRHGRVTNRISVFISNHVIANQLGEVCAAETGFKITSNPDTVRGPDVAFIRRERMEVDDDQRHFEGAPDLVVEVMSPGDRRSQVAAKIAQWLDAGAEEVWSVDPEERAVTVYRREAPLLRVLGESEMLDSPKLLPGFRVKVSEFFPAAPATSSLPEPKAKATKSKGRGKSNGH